jgi:SAM-dependent methyltransferase
LGYRAARALFAGASLHVFERLDRPRDCRALARRTGADAARLEVLLDALAACGFLSKRGRRYALAPACGPLLRPGGPLYLGPNLRYQELMWPAWGDLTAVVRGRAKRRPLDVLLRRAGGAFVRDYIEGMRAIAAGPAAEVAARLGLDRPERLLDVGCGPGTFSAALLARHPGLRADLLDLPATLRVTRAMMRQEGLLGRVRFLAGDYRARTFGSARYDLVLLSHVTHDEGPADVRRMLRRAALALRRGGTVAVHDFMLEEGRTGPPFAALFALHMLAGTRSGRVYTGGEYRRWMREAGLGSLRRHEICPGAPNASVLLAGSR